jgi:Tfp pilus assembly PilM family ATPase/outer membrane murein-binding lipoprotein Lpp
MSPALSPELTRLRQEQRLARDAWVTIWGLRSVHQFLRLPPTATDDLEAMSLREAHHELAAFEAEVGRASVALMIGDDVHVGTHRRREVSLTAVAESEIARQVQPLVDAGFTVRGVCTPAMALTAVARHHERATAEATVAYVALESNAMCVAIVRDGVLLSSREIPWEFADSADAVRERLVDELRRSLLFFRQSFRAVVERIVLCGGMPNLRALTSSTSAALNVPVETLDSLSGIDAEAVPEPADTFRATVAALWPAIAIAAQSSDQLNLLATPARVQRETRTRMMRIAAAVVAGVLILSAWYFMTRGGKDNRAAEVEQLQQQVARLESEVKREPARPVQETAAKEERRPKEASAEPELVVGSILYSSERRLAIINGRIVRIGDRIGSSTILDIEPRAVIVESSDGTKRTIGLTSR